MKPLTHSAVIVLLVCSTTQTNAQAQQNAPQQLSVDTIFGEAAQPINGLPVTTVASSENLVNNVVNAGCQQSACCCTPQPGFLDLLMKGDHCFDKFIAPVTNPLWAMDPRSGTWVRTVFINQMIPEDSILAGGDLQIYAVQASLALNERFSLFATKDGYTTLQADGLGGNNAEGWGDMAAGFKYVLHRDVCNQTIVSGGIVYELSQGSAEIFQGNGDGMWHFFLSAGKGWDRTHFIANAGWHLPNNASDESQSLYYSLHLDYELREGIYALTELNGIHYTRSGRGLAVNDEGGDWLNVGASVAGEHFVSMAWGAAFVLNDLLTISAAWEVPLTNNQHLLESRTTILATLSF